MNTTPGWEAAQNGAPGNLDATNHAAQLGQFLGTHNVKPIYMGAPVWQAGQQSTAATQQFFQIPPGNPAFLGVSDLSQPFVMSGTTIGRVQLAMQAYGNGADVQVSLCPDNGSGSPLTSSPIASTVLPASQILNLTAGDLANPSGPIATADNNTAVLASLMSTNYAQPAVSANGAATYSAVACSGNYGILLGGYDSVGTASANNVATIQYLGSKTIAGPVPQPSLPNSSYNGFATASSTTGMVMYAGGLHNQTSTYLSNVWTASWNANTGTIGSWTAQQALPTTVYQNSGATAGATRVQAGCVNWGNYVYVIGGSVNGSAANACADVIYAQATNGQIQSWVQATPLPFPLQLSFCGAVNGWLIVAGGQHGDSTAQSATYYAKINADGSLGNWINGPFLPTAVYALVTGWQTVVTDSALVIIDGVVSSSPVTPTNSMFILPVDSTGPASQWYSQQFVAESERIHLAFPNGATVGGWDAMGLGNTSYDAYTLTTTPMISVPLYATGLTSGNTYHIVVHQIGGDTLNNYVQVGEVFQYSGASPFLYSPRYTQGTWTPHSQYILYLNIWDDSVANGVLLHTWQDPNANGLATQTTTYINNETTNLLLGYCEATTLPNEPRNQNTLTTNSTTPWTATNCTLAASSAQVHSGYAFSGLMTPNGTSATVFITSENIPVTAGKWYVPGSWVYSPTGYSNVQLSVDWYDSGSNYISTGNTTAPTIAANTWTLISAAFQAPATAATGRIDVIEAGTPAATNLLYLSYANLVAYDPTTLSSVAKVNYPTGAPWPPLGVTQLA